jgi:8-oxo-dGTP diphosphatase/2-hydroxy-dATP diphosphatase
MTPSAKKQLTLCLVCDGSRLLLGMKKRGLGSGRWNGFGGKVEPGETVEDAACRELREECGVEAKGMEKRGVLEFAFKGDPIELEVHVFGATGVSGEPRETDEMRPQWFGLDGIPYDTMWPDDRFWLPLFLEGKKFKGTFLYDGENVILAKSLMETDSI